MIHLLSPVREIDIIKENYRNPSSSSSDEEDKKELN
jgi:hypothetical protein